VLEAPEAVEPAALAAPETTPVEEAEAVAEAEATAEPAAGFIEPEADLVEAVADDGIEDKDAEDDDDRKKGKKKGKKKPAVEITFDEDLGMFITRKKRKPGRAKDEMFGLLDEE